MMADALAVRGGLNYSGEVAGVAELVDALVLGTSGESRGGSSPSARTTILQEKLVGIWEFSASCWGRS